MNPAAGDVSEPEVTCVKRTRLDRLYGTSFVLIVCAQNLPCVGNFFDWWISIFCHFSLKVKSYPLCKYSTIKHVSTDKAQTNNTGLAKDGQSCHLIKPSLFLMTVKFQ